MPCFTLPVSAAGQLLIDVLVTPGDVARVPQGDANRFRALVDTGATGTCVTERLARKLNLEDAGTVETITALHRGETPVYHVCVHIPSPVAKSDGSGEELVFRSFAPVQASEIPPLHENFDLVIGMDIISAGSLHVSDGHFTFCI